MEGDDDGGNDIYIDRWGNRVSVNGEVLVIVGLRELHDRIGGCSDVRLGGWNTTRVNYRRVVRVDCQKVGCVVVWQGVMVIFWRSVIRHFGLGQ